MMTEAGFTWEVEPSYAEGGVRDAGVIPGEGLMMPDGTPFPDVTIIVPAPGYDPLRATAGVYIEQWMRQLGIPVTAEMTPFTQIIYQRNSGDYDMYVLGWGLGSFPGYLCDFFTGETGIADGSNVNFYESERLQEGCLRFQTETDLAAAREIAFELQDILADELPYITLFTLPMIDAYRNVDFPFTDVFDGIGSGLYGAPHFAVQD
jgi:ABC-type transport system substrate-binding protein